MKQAGSTGLFHLPAALGSGPAGGRNALALASVSARRKPPEGGFLLGRSTPHFGAMRMAPSRRITSPLSMSFVTIWWTSLA